MMIATLALLSAVAQADPTPESELLTIDEAVVVRQSRPIATSGVLAIYADFDVEISGGRRITMYLLYLSDDQFIPPVNSRCRITYISNRVPLDGGVPVNIVEDLACDTGALARG